MMESDSKKPTEEQAPEATGKDALEDPTLVEPDADGHPAEGAEEAEPADEELTEAEDAAALKDQLLRAVAEAENTRRRAERQVKEASQYAISSFARDMLTISDNLRRALDALPEDFRDKDEFKSFVEGVNMTERELLNALERHGIRKIDPLGERFDHNFHQAMFEVEDAEPAPGTIVQVVQPGYVIRDRLLRPALVGVAKAPAKPKEGVDKTV